MEKRLLLSSLHTKRQSLNSYQLSVKVPLDNTGGKSGTIPRAGERCLKILSEIVTHSLSQRILSALEDSRMIFMPSKKYCCFSQWTIQNLMDPFLIRFSGAESPVIRSVMRHAYINGCPCSVFLQGNLCVL